MAAFLWACCNIIDKVTLSRLVKSPMTVMIVLAVFGLLSSLVLATTVGLERFNLKEVILAFAAGACYSSMNFFYVKAVSVADISRITPLFALSTFFIALIAGVSLHEIFSLRTYVGNSCLTLGALTLSTTRLRSLDLHQGFFLMMAADLSVAVTEVVQKYLLKTHGYWSVYAYSRFFSFVALLPIIWLYNDGLRQLISKRRYSVLSLMSLSELLNLAAILCIVIASSRGFVTLVNATTEVQHLIVLLMATFISLLAPRLLKEDVSLRLFTRKLGSIAAILLGVALVVSY